MRFGYLGGEIATATEFWKVLVDKLDGWIQVEISRSKSKSESTETSGSVEGGVPFLKARGEISAGAEELDERIRTVRRDRPAAQVASDLLLLTKPVLVIDDFHYLSEAGATKDRAGDASVDLRRSTADLAFGAAPGLRRCPR